eukprot:m51a1_g816 putative ring canal kelch homolog (723) ;mRNA; f:689722-692553
MSYRLPAPPASTAPHPEGTVVCVICGAWSHAAAKGARGWRADVCPRHGKPVEKVRTADGAALCSQCEGVAQHTGLLATYEHAPAARSSALEVGASAARSSVQAKRAAGSSEAARSALAKEAAHAKERVQREFDALSRALEARQEAIALQVKLANKQAKLFKVVGRAMTEARMPTNDAACCALWSCTRARVETIESAGLDGGGLDSGVLDFAGDHKDLVDAISSFGAIAASETDLDLKRCSLSCAAPKLALVGSCVQTTVVAESIVNVVGSRLVGTRLREALRKLSLRAVAEPSTSLDVRVAEWEIADDAESAHAQIEITYDHPCSVAVSAVLSGAAIPLFSVSFINVDIAKSKAEFPSQLRASKEYDVPLVLYDVDKNELVTAEGLAPGSIDWNVEIEDRRSGNVAVDEALGCVHVTLEASGSYAINIYATPAGTDKWEPLSGSPYKLIAVPPGPVRTLEAFDYVSGSWATLPGMCSRRHGLGVAVHGGCILALGGHDGKDFLSTVELYDPNVNRWSPVEPMPSACQCPGVQVVGDRLFVVGGSRTNAYLSSTSVFDIQRGSWSGAAGMSSPRSYHATALVGDKIYVIGGHNGEKYLNTGECYDPEADRWLPIPPLKRPKYGAGVVVADKCIYLIGGYNGNISSGAIERFDTDSQTWATLTPSELCRFGLAAAQLDGKFYAAGGQMLSEYLADVECYSTTEAKWSPCPPMPTRRQWLALAVL